jgi:hypothetical protein
MELTTLFTPKTKKKDDQETLYYTDHQALQRFEREVRDVTLGGNNLLRVFTEVTGFEISIWNELLLIATDPQAYFRHRFFELNKEEFEHLSKLRLPIQDIIQLPDNFDEVLKAANKFTSLINGNEKLYTLENGQVKPSQKNIDRINNRANLYARTPEEKIRLDRAQRMIALFNEIEQEQKQILKPHQFEEMKKHLLHCRPLPYCLKIVGDEKGNEILIPNPGYVDESYAGLQGFNPTKKQIAIAVKESAPKLGVPYLKVKVKLASGGTVLYLVEQSKKAEYLMKWGDAAEWLDGLWNEQDKPYGTPLDRLQVMRESTIANLSSESLFKALKNGINA